jgi:hypothetical protein
VARHASGTPSGVWEGTQREEGKATGMVNMQYIMDGAQCGVDDTTYDVSG